MAKFEVMGSVTRIVTLMSKANKPYCMLTVFEPQNENDFNTALFEIVATGNAQKFAAELKEGDEIIATGNVTSRSYTDKNGIERHGISLALAPIPVAKKSHGLKPTVMSAKPIGADDIDQIPF